MKAICDGQVEVFLNICDQICFPVSLEKTVWGCHILVFLGLLIDTIEQVIWIPKEKVDKALEMIDKFLSKSNHKATVLEVQHLCGTLNFLCKCVIPGRVFLHCTYNLVSNENLKQHHQVRITQETRQDLMVWQKFLMHPSIFCRPFMDLQTFSSEDIDMYSDASGKIAFRAYCGPLWTAGQWSKYFLEKKKPSIEYLEMYGLMVGVLLWIRLFKNKRICIHCDNKMVKFNVNKNTVGCKNSMMLMRLIVLECMVHNVKLSVEYVKSANNGKANTLSRNQMDRFRTLDKEGKMNKFPEAIPDCIWPPEKIWLD